MILESCTSSGLKAADAAIMAGPGRLHGVTLIGGSDAATLVVYDNASAASGTALCKVTVAAGASIVWYPPAAVAVNNGLYADVSGTLPGYLVHFAQG